jgi:hypothetical protein
VGEVLYTPGQAATLALPAQNGRNGVGSRGFLNVVAQNAAVLTTLPRRSDGFLYLSNLVQRLVILAACLTFRRIFVIV